ncbi:MAG: hypothetical protein ACR2MM_06175 [Flavobacteriaceae bacterium]
MKRNIVLLALTAALTFSCSSDKDNENNDSIVGTWDLTAYEIDEATATDDQEFARDILEFLALIDCTILSYTFNEDGTVISRDSGDYLEIDVNQGGSGLDIPCPEESDVEDGMYTFEEGVLTYMDEVEGNTEVNVEISNNTIRIGGADLGIDNFADGGTLIFSRR